LKPKDGVTNFVFTKDDGPLFVGTVRQTIYQFLIERKIDVAEEVIRDPRFEQKMGCFVTLKQYDGRKSLRGCIGFSEPIYKLSHALTNAAIFAATEDPRFEPVSPSELDNLLVEVSILTKPERIDTSSPEDIISKIRVGTDGLVMKWNFGSGLLLPQVARELNWSAKSFLENLGIKAGSGSNQWLMPSTQIFRFQSKIFEEITPRGKVILT
jgi:uncharacterized protein